jgi:hypothetical protein
MPDSQPWSAAVIASQAAPAEAAGDALCIADRIPFLTPQLPEPASRIAGRLDTGIGLQAINLFSMVRRLVVESK